MTTGLATGGSGGEIKLSVGYALKGYGGNITLEAGRTEPSDSVGGMVFVNGGNGTNVDNGWGGKVVISGGNGYGIKDVYPAIQLIENTANLKVKKVSNIKKY